MVYLGGLIHSDGGIGAELSRRIGMATAEFRSLSKVWSHANVSLQQKMTYFDSLVMSKLLYALGTGVFIKAKAH